jgi:hypothetical protein
MTDHKYGLKGHIVDAFIEHLKSMTNEDWARVNAAWDAAWDAARDAARSAAGSAAGNAARSAAGNAAGYAAWCAAGDAAWYVSGNAAGHAAGEIQGADLMRKRGQPFFFLPMFGFADEQAVLAALQPKEGE